MSNDEVAYIVVSVDEHGYRHETWRVGIASAQQTAHLWREEFPAHVVTIEPANGRLPE